MSNTSAEARNSVAPGWHLEFGACAIPGQGVRFRVWAPHGRTLDVRIVAPAPCTARLDRGADEVFEVTVPEVGAGADYLYVIDGRTERPDPVSRWQPHGVHGPSRVVDPGAFGWTDGTWAGIPLEDYVLYELHVGTFTPEGTFEGAIAKLPYLRELGVTAVELMPVAEFPGAWNWGYDGVQLYAPQSTYGGPEGLRRLVDACHRHGLAVVLDVVYNHLGPEGNCLADYGPYFSARYRTPWGEAVNFDGPFSDEVRRYFVDNARYWIVEHHVDALRLDAIHHIFDCGARHVLEELAEAVHAQAHALGRRSFVIAESNLNDVRIINPVEAGGYGVDAQWNDDFHHALHALLTGSHHGYFADFGRMDDLRKAIAEGFVYDGRRSTYRGRRHGSSSAGCPGRQFVVCVQNHDQVANGSGGDRIATLVTLEEQKLAAAVLLCTPNVPMLFMGQEYGETVPFLYFTSHGDPAIADTVRRGRAEEFRSFHGNREVADPQDERTFFLSKLNWTLGNRTPHAELLALYRDLIALRRRSACLGNCRRDLARAEASEEDRWLRVERGDPSGESALCLFNFQRTFGEVPLAIGSGRWRLALWTGDRQYGGAAGVAPPPSVIGASGGRVGLAPSSAAVYLKE